MGPQTEFSDNLHATKYRMEGEDFREAMNRIASGLKDNDVHFRPLRDILLSQRFLPAGRIQAAIGVSKQVTPYNCYVSGTIEDSFVEGGGCIMDRAKEAAATMRMGGGIGYDFSSLRPRGDLIRKLQAQSSGPITFMGIFNEVCLATSSSGHRRGAQMAVLRVDHPDIEQFIRVKQNQEKLRGFNISIGVTDEFMHCVLNKKPFNLTWGGVVYNTIDAEALWEMIMRSTWDWAEPGVLFIDHINDLNNLYYCEDIAATNPCGEQPLPPFGACLLGSFNLVKFLVNTGGNPSKWKFDWKAFEESIPPVVRAMDNVVDRAIYPLQAQRKEALSKRRMGLGVTALANAGEALGHRYGDEGFLNFQRKVLRTLRNESYRASALLAAEKGAFPLYDKALYLSGKFVKQLPDDIRKLIGKHGIRNSHLTSIAPTGTISLCADNVSSGIEPVWDYISERIVQTFDAPTQITIEDYGYKFLGVEGKRTSEVTAQEHLAVLSIASKYMDSAVSKTCNVPPTMEWADFKDIYMQAWKNGCKGCTTFNSGGKRFGILKTKGDNKPEPQQEDSCEINPETGRSNCE